MDLTGDTDMTKARPKGITIPPTCPPDDVLWYNMEHQKAGGRRGECAVFNFAKFAKSKERKGTEKDRKRIEEVFGEKLGFHVEPYDNCTKNGMLDALQKLADMDHSNSDGFCCFLLSHGNEDVILCADDEEVPLATIYGFFTGTNGETLAGKPKLFFIQACRGNEIDEGYPQPDCSSVTDSHNFTRNLPSDADIFIFYATCPGRFSYRNQNEGSFFIQILCDVIERDYHRKDFRTMMTSVNRYVAKHEIKYDKNKFVKQMPNTVSTLTKNLLFAPQEMEDHHAKDLEETQRVFEGRIEQMAKKLEAKNEVEMAHIARIRHPEIQMEQQETGLSVIGAIASQIPIVGPFYHLGKVVTPLMKVLEGITSNGK